MEEKVLIKGNASGFKIVPVIVLILGAITMLFALLSLQIVICVIGVAIIIGGIVLINYVKNCEICVTNKRIYGNAAFGARVDIPLDSVSAVGMLGLFNGVSVSSSSGRIKFLYISNADKVYTIISKILMARQNTLTYVPQEIKSSAGEIKEYKELLDSGVITQEEFETKKKQLLGR